MRAVLRPVLFAATVLGTASHASAQLTAFTSRAGFTAAAGALTTEPFDRPFTLVPVAGGAFPITGGGTVTFDANHGGGTFGGGDLFADLHPVGDAQPPRFLRFTFAAPVTAFGADFSAFDNSAVRLRALVGGTTFDVGQGFFGVVSSVPFTTFELRDPTARTFFVVDNASVAASVVPEPGAGWLLLGGVGAGAAVARRRRRAAPVTSPAAEPAASPAA